MRTFFFTSALVVASGLSTSVLAGDQPVITTGFPVDHGDSVIYRFDTLDTGTIGDGGDLAGAGGAISANTSDGVGNTVGATSLSRNESAALYARLMAEAKERGLK